MNLGENIYKCRTAKNLSQGELSDALSVSRQSVSKWENGNAVPELDKLMKMSKLFDVTLDELVFGHTKKEEKPVDNTIAEIKLPSVRVVLGFVILMFGMIFFLLSIFWGNHLYFGEAFGELTSIMIVLLSITMIATYNIKVLSLCAVIYWLYGIVCFGIMNVTSMSNYIFTFIAGIIILVWFIILGLKSNK